MPIQGIGGRKREKIQETKRFVEVAYDTCVEILRAPAVNVSENGKKLAEELWAVEGYTGKCSVDGVILLPEPVSQALLLLLATLLNSHSLAEKFINEGHTTAFDALLSPACMLCGSSRPFATGGLSLALTYVTQLGLRFGFISDCTEVS